jgi:acetyl esterase/lipase
MSNYAIHPDFKVLNLIPKTKKFMLPFYNFFLRSSFNLCALPEDIEMKQWAIKGYLGESFPVMIFRPKNLKAHAPCLVYYHGGGFFLEAAGLFHRRAVIEYARRAKCVVVFPHYRVSVKNPFPTSLEDSYQALRWTRENARELDIDPDNIAVGGDSAGGCLAACLAQMALDRKLMKLKFQLLIYPVCDHTMKTPSMAEFQDTPIWNTPSSKLMWELYLKGVHGEMTPDYVSPLQRKDLKDSPSTYIETAEFDCLRDEALLYSERLRQNGVNVVLNETKGTVHAYDLIFQSEITKGSFNQRIAYLKKGFGVS